MTCEVAMERLLEADPAELEGRGEGELARHVAGCERCGRVAAWLVAELAEVDEALGAYASAGDPEAAVRAILGPGSPGLEREHPAPAMDRRASGVVASPPVREPRATMLRPWRWIGVPVAAAAVLAALLLLGRGPHAPPPVPIDAGSEQAARVAVTAPADRGVAVMETQNPNITIIWLYEREES